MRSPLLALLVLFTPALVFGQKCGSPAIKPDTSKIVGGKTAIAYSWPWQIGFFQGGGLGSSLMCGGSVIDNDWVMTAGHCCYGNTDQPDQFSVKLGDFNQHDNKEPGEIVAKIKRMVLHPKFDYNTISNDICLLQLEKPVNYTDHISPVCLPKNDTGIVVPTNSPYVTGWGTLREGGLSLPAKLQQVSLPFLSTSACQTEYGDSLMPDVMICAGEPGKDSCQGDSGGPLVFQHPSDKLWYEYGIVSWGQGCAEKGHAGIYSRVTAFCDFIQTTTGKSLCM